MIRCTHGGAKTVWSKIVTCFGSLLFRLPFNRFFLDTDVRPADRDAVVNAEDEDEDEDERSSPA